MSATEPAISTDGDTKTQSSQFQYLMKHPLKLTKLMLKKLDDLITGTHDHDSFYVVQIKEGLNTT